MIGSIAFPTTDSPAFHKYTHVSNRLKQSLAIICDKVLSMHAYLTDHHLAVLVLVQVNVELRMLLLHKVKIALGCAVYRYRRAA